jgi:hypothetical protein
MPDIASFVSQFSIGARPNLFRVEIPFLGDRLAFLAKGAQLPAKTISKVPVNFMDNIFYIAGDTSYQDWTITVINDVDFSVKFAIENWMNIIKANGQTIGDKGWGYLSEGYVTQLDGLGNDIVTYKFFNMFPTDMAAIELSWDSKSTVEEFQLTFSYSHFGKFTPII